MNACISNYMFTSNSLNCNEINYNINDANYLKIYDMLDNDKKVKP